MSKVANKIRYWISRLNFHRRISVLEQREFDLRIEGREDILDHLRMGRTRTLHFSRKCFLRPSPAVRMIH